MSVNSNCYFLKTIQNRNGRTDSRVLCLERKHLREIPKGLLLKDSLLLVIYNLQGEIRWSLVSTDGDLKLPNGEFHPDPDHRVKFSLVDEQKKLMRDLLLAAMTSRENLQSTVVLCRAL